MPATDPILPKPSVSTDQPNEVLDSNGRPHSRYLLPFTQLPASRPAAMRALGEHIEATLREMGVNYGSALHGAQAPWKCDLLPHVFSSEEWPRVVAGVRQRVRAFEHFLRDVYGPREILRAGVVPIHLVLGSPYYQSASVGLPRPQDAYLHLSGLCLARDSAGGLVVKCHQLGRAGGMAFMMQNRRALARVLPGFFEENAISSLADMPPVIGEALRESAPEGVKDPNVVLLSSGPKSAMYFEHSFLARRTGISLVQGGDLLVLDDHLYLKTVRGLKRVDVVYNRVADAWLDPLVLRRGSMLGVPGLVHCLRRGTLTLLNAIGSQLSDDRALLCFAPHIIRFYLGEESILPTVRTFWLGDIDQRELVLEHLAEFQIDSIEADSLSAGIRLPPDELVQAIRKEPTRYVAQPVDDGALTLHFREGKAAAGSQDHHVFALRRGDNYGVFPGALTRVFPAGLNGEETWLSKDSWVPAGRTKSPSLQVRRRRVVETPMHSRDVTSRVAEAFYWMGRYLERAYHHAYLIQAIETLETEELNSAERKEYRPMWNRLLPPLETSAGESRRSITTRLDRYRLTLLPKPGSVVSTLERVMANAETVQESLSPEAWATLSSLGPLFQRAKFRTKIAEEEASRVTLRLTAKVTQRIPQFLAIAGRTMLADDGWRFCEVGERLERAIITAHAVCSIGRELAAFPQPTEIQLSAFLRLLGTRDAYRRIFQVRAEPAALLEVLWQHPEAPRSVLRCLTFCLDLLREARAPGSEGAARTVAGLKELIQRIRRIDWSEFFPARAGEEELAPAPPAVGPPSEALPLLLANLLAATHEIHLLISDGFLSHQAYISQTLQPILQSQRNEH